MRGGIDYSQSPNLWVRKGTDIIRNKPSKLIEPLEQIGFPDRGLLYDNYEHLKRNPVKIFMTTRGCPFKCTYCFNHAYNDLYKGLGKVIRRLMVDHVIAELSITNSLIFRRYLQYYA